MKLNDLLKELRKVFLIDDYLKAYLYEDKIEIIDYTPEIELDNGNKLDEFYGIIATIWIEDNKINVIEDKSMGMITPANKDTFIYLANLIGTKIEDYDEFSKLPNRKNKECITI